MRHSARIVYGAILAILSLVIVFFSIVVMYIVCNNKKDTKEEKSRGKTNPENPIVKLSTSPYTLVDIYVATDGFNENRVIDKCWLGMTYKAMLATGELVAVKRIHPHLVLRHVGLRFSLVLKWLSQANHPHVVPILGFSEGPGERIMVIEYFQGTKSLEFYLHQNNDKGSIFAWGQRFRAAAGVARGLEYLHEMMTPSVVHGCVKPSNILLDVNFNAKICDYGLSFLASNENEGLLGYVDEEYWIESKGASKESDVYGLGIILLELLSGKKSDRGLIVKWSLPLIKEMKLNELLDNRLVVPHDMKSIERLAKVACACVGNSRKIRPSIGQVVAILNTLEGYPFLT